jgi:solute carrier family 35 protein E3
VGVASVTDVQLNLVGTIFGVLAVVSTAQYQIWQGTKQREAKLNGMQCAASVAFVQIVFGGICAFIFEGPSLVKLAEMDTLSDDQLPDDYLYLRELIVLSCLLAVSVNVHSFSMIGRTSAVTWQVVGHGKTCLILVSGYIMTPISDFDLFVKNLIGVSIAMLGVILYSNLKLVEGRPGEKDWCDQYLPAPLFSCFIEPVPSISAPGVNKTGAPAKNSGPSHYAPVTQKDDDE